METDRTEQVSPTAPAVFSPQLASGTRVGVGGRYEVHRVLGSGGYAVVYLAFDRELRRPVALKVLRADRMSPAALQRLRREAAVARDASSPRLVRIFDVGSSGPAVYLTMEVVEGESLRERLARGPLPVAEAARIAGQILEGLQVLHGLHVVHRDVKPGNVLLTPEGEVKLADFGLAFRWGSDETRLTLGEGVLGTLDYVSPEQALGLEVDPRCDLYSLGLILFEMLAGRLPHEEKSGLGAVLGRLRQRAPDIRQLRPETPAWLAAVVAGLLEKDRAARYPSAAAVLTDLRARSVLQTRRGQRRLVWSAAAAVLVLGLTGAAVAFKESQRPRFSHLVSLEGNGVAAVDKRGETLWELPQAGLAQQFAPLRRPGSSRPLLAAILVPPGNFDANRNRILSLLDADTGDLLKRIVFPDGARHFPDFSNLFGTMVRALDLDGDGGDEVLVTYTHAPLWPSFTVLYEPRIDRSRILFVGSGHHRVVGAGDLDGDGRAEVVLAGINNRMGWFSGVAAVRLNPAANETVPGQDSLDFASSPDEAYTIDRGHLLWYALASRSFPSIPGHLRVDPDRRRISIAYQGAPDVEIGFDGFLVAHPSKTPPAQRQDARWSAYAHLREANRLLRSGFPSEALPECDAARQAADLSGDPLLGEWVSRVRGKILAAAERFEEADTLFLTLAARSASASDIAFDAARSFHLQGRLERALAWYRRGIVQGGTSEAGRGKYEYLEGIVLILGELERWEEGFTEVARFESSYRNFDTRLYREYLRWKMREIPVIEGIAIKPGNPDLQRYWMLEFRLARGEEPQALLRDLREEKPRSSETRALLLSLEGEILERLGRREEAFLLAQQADFQVRSRASTDPFARAHLDLVAGRLARKRG